MPVPRTLLCRAAADPAADADLLVKFVAARDEAAFAELVRRHGPVVYRVCRRLVGPCGADDAFQATFLVLATRARGVKQVGPWLVGVAGRVARQMRRRDRRAGSVSSPAVLEAVEDRRQGADVPRSPELVEQLAILTDELTRLPDRYRGPVVQCLLHGRTHAQAAADLGTCDRTVRRRLDQAKALLRVRLESRGVLPVVAAGLVAAAGDGSAHPPLALVDRTAELVFDYLAGGAAVASPAAIIVHGVTTTMLARCVKLGMLATAAGLTAVAGLAGDPGKPAAKADAPPVAAKPADPPKLTTNPATATAETANFRVTAPTSDLALKLATEAERLRKELAVRWVGKELPAWRERCVVLVDRPTGPDTGSTTFTYGNAAVVTMRMDLSGPPDRMFAVTLPHEVMHCVLATIFGRPVPRWADEGIAGLAEPNSDQFDAKCRELLNAGRGIALKALFPMNEYPKDVQALHAQGVSVCRFLLTRSVRTDIRTTGPETAAAKNARARIALIQFVHYAHHHGWDAAAKMVYDLASVDDLEKVWITWLRQPPAPVPALPGSAVAPATASTAIQRALSTEIAWQLVPKHQQWGVPEPDRVYFPATEYTPGDRQRPQVNVSYDTERKAYLPTVVRFGGPLDEVLDQDVPVAAATLALMHLLDFKQQLPGWAVVGVPHLDAAASKQVELDARCRELVQAGQAIKLSTFFADAVWHQPDTHAQGHSVGRFLLSRVDANRGQPRAELVKFLREGLHKDWAAAAKLYGFDSVDALEQAWLLWLTVPASKFPVPAKPADVPRIPPVKLDR